MTIKTDIGYSTPDAIFVRGRNLSEDILGKVDFIDMIFLAATGEVPDANMRKMADTIMVASTDHGLTPISIAARLTYLGAPESVQGAVASGLLGAGDRFLGTMQTAAIMLQENIGDLQVTDSDETFAKVAQTIVADFRSRKEILPGLGHPTHVDGDPRTPVIKDIAGENGFDGKYWKLMEAISNEANESLGRKLPINVTGAVGATISEMGLEPIWARAFALIGRSAGIVAHLIDERKNPIAKDIWLNVLAQDDSAKETG